MVVSLDLSSLVGFAGLSASSSTSRTAARAPAAPETLTPWDFRREQIADDQRVRRALEARTLIVPRDSSFDREGVPEDHKKLFTLYNALASLQALATAAADPKASPNRFAALQKRFETGYAETLAFANGLKLETLTMLAGQKVEQAETAATVARTRFDFTTRTLVRGDATAPLPALAAAEPFTIRVRRSGVDTDMTIDLAGMGATPRNLGEVVRYVNDQLNAAGFQSRLARVELPQPPRPAGSKEPAPLKEYAVRVTPHPSEQLTFVAGAPRPAVYLLSQGTNAAELRKLDDSGAAPQTTAQIAIQAGTRDLEMSRLARDASGNVFALGTTNASFGGQANQAARDVVLRKFDSAGNLLWTKLLGATERAEGLALAVDGQGAAVVAGQISGKLSPGAGQGGADAFVVKYSATGDEVFARQIGSLMEDRATALAVGADGAIYVGGATRGRVVGATTDPSGGLDAFVAKFSATGTREYVRQFGTAGDDRVAALGMAADGNLIVAMQENGGAARVAKFASADGASPAMWSEALGDLQGGSIGGLAIDGGAVFVAGGTGNAALDAGGTASILAAHSGGTDGFVSRIDDSGASAAAAFTTYLGSGAGDRINGIAVSGGSIYVAGDTTGTLPGATATRAGVSNAFAARMSSAGALEWARQFGVTEGAGFGRGIVADTTGASTLDALGLPKGTLSLTPNARTLTAQTTVRAGDWFEISIDGRAPRRIAVAAGETLQTLANKINSVLSLDGRASVQRGSAGDRLRIVANGDSRIDLRAGPKEFDALAGLGLAPGRVEKVAKDEDGKPLPADGPPTFGLGLRPFLAIRDRSEAAAARGLVTAAMQTIRNAYREITRDPEAEALLARAQPTGQASAQTLRELANYQAGLQRLLGGTSA